MAYKVTRVNVTRVLNTKNAKKEKRNGRDVIIVPSATMPDDIIMNKVKYPAAEIKASHMSLNRSPAPLNHPMVNGKFVSARDPEGLNVGWIGAWNENVRYADGKIRLDKVIDVEKANQSPEGKRVLDAIEKGKAIHTSTGLLAHMESVKEKDHDFVAHEIEFDHDAILLDFVGAATPEQGVGIFVNSDGVSEDVEVVNSMWEQADQELDWAVDSIVRALEKKARFPIVERIKAAITEAFSGLGAEATVTNEEAEKMSDDKIDKLSAKVDALADSMKTIGETITNGVATVFTNALKPLVDAQLAVVANQKAAEEAEKGTLIDKIVKANLLTETVAKETPLATLKALAANVQAASAAGIRPGIVSNSGGSVVSQFKPPAGEKKGA